MTKALSFLLLFLSVVPFFGQTGFEVIDSASQKLPKGLKTADEIALFLTKDLKKEDEKVRAIYIWITHNIKYDMAQISTPITYTEETNIADEALKNRKGVCEHYAQLFYQMCTAVGITSYVIPGYTRQSDSAKIDPLNHAWNGVVVNNKYYLVDATWDAGYFNKGGYVHEFQDDFFLVEPQTFLKTHMPFDPIWQFLNNPITHTAYASKDFSKLGQRGNFAFRDSIIKITAIDSISRIEKSIARIQKAGVTNVHIREEISQMENLMEYYRYNHWVSRFNAINGELKLAVDEINSAVAYHNAFFKMINKKQGDTQVREGELKTNLSNANDHLTKGKAFLKIAESQLGSLEYLGGNKDHLQNAKTNKKNLLAYIVQLKESNLKLEASIAKNWEYYQKRL
ncbi:MAG: transglutaminase domain-containing protein [Flavobacteriales bacterium]